MILLVGLVIVLGLVFLISSSSKRGNSASSTQANVNAQRQVPNRNRGQGGD